MLRLGFLSDPTGPDLRPPVQTVYCTLTESVVTGRYAEIRYVDSAGYARDPVCHADGRPVRLPLDTDCRDVCPLMYRLVGHRRGRYAIIIRGHAGRFAGRRDFALFEEDDELTEPSPPTPVEAVEAELAAERDKRREAEEAARRAEADQRATADELAAARAELERLRRTAEHHQTAPPSQTIPPPTPNPKRSDRSEAGWLQQLPELIDRVETIVKRHMPPDEDSPSR